MYVSLHYVAAGFCIYYLVNLHHVQVANTTTQVWFAGKDFGECRIQLILTAFQTILFEECMVSTAFCRSCPINNSLLARNKPKELTEMDLSTFLRTSFFLFGVGRWSFQRTYGINGWLSSYISI